MISVYIDGASRGNPGDAGIGIIAKEGSKTIFELAEYIGKSTNNVAEYMALIRALEEILIIGKKEAHFVSDSELLVRQVNGQYRVKDETLKVLHSQAGKLINKFTKFSIEHKRREKNKKADGLANKGIDSRFNNPDPLFSSK